jgi:biotin operon repressor
MARMSRSLATLVYSKTVGSMARKAVLAYMADRANDDGTGVWAAKQRIADEVECSKQTVITTIAGLIEDGLLIEVGHRKMSNGYTVDYSIIVDAVAALPDAKADPQGVKNWTGRVHNWTGPELDESSQLTPRGQAALPKPSLNRPIKKKTTPSSLARAKCATHATRLPADWRPTTLTGQSAEAVVPWQAGRLERELSKFRDHWAASSGANARKHDWQAAWRNWVLKADEQGDRNGNGRLAQRTKGTPGVGRTTEAANRLIARLSAETPSRFS